MLEMPSEEEERFNCSTTTRFGNQHAKRGEARVGGRTRSDKRNATSGSGKLVAAFRSTGATGSSSGVRSNIPLTPPNSRYNPSSPAPAPNASNAPRIPPTTLSTLSSSMPLTLILTGSRPSNISKYRTVAGPRWPATTSSLTR